MSSTSRSDADGTASGRMGPREARLVERWRSAGVIDDATAERIRDWESRHGSADISRFGRFAFGFGGLLLGAGVLLFVAANWQWLSPWGRFALLAVTISVLHAGGGLAAARSPALATTLHAAGTAAPGGGIFLAGQVFNLAEHWPVGFLLWSAGAAGALWLLRDWPQAVWLAILAPAWLIGEWLASDLAGSQRLGNLLAGLFVLAVAYVAAGTPAHGAAWRRPVALLGALVLIPVGVLLPFEPGLRPGVDVVGSSLAAAAGVAAIVLPLLVGVWLRGRGAWPLLLAESLLARVRPGKPFVIDGAARRALVTYDYPGNVRELRNVVERANLLADDERIELRHLPPEVVTRGTAARAAASDVGGDVSGRTLRSAERDALALALARHDGSRRALAETRGISERTLYRKLQAFGLSPRRRETGAS